MNKTTLATFLAGCIFTLTAAAQTTNGPATEIEALEQQTNTIIIKAFGPAGTVSIGNGILTVRQKESTDSVTGRRLYGLVLDYNAGGDRLRAVVDYADVDSLVDGVDYIRTINYDVTKLPSFEAFYMTKSGWRVISYCSQRQSGIQLFIEFGEGTRIPVNLDQMTQLRNLIAQTKKSLDALRTAK